MSNQVEMRPMRLKRGQTIAVIIVIVLVGVGLGGHALWRDRQMAEEMRTAIVKRGSIQATVDVLGRIEPLRQLALSTRVSGTVRRIAVREGEMVLAGDVILELDGEEQRAQVEAARRRLMAADLQLEGALQAPDSAAIRLARARLRLATAARRNAQDDYDEIADQPDAESSDEAVDLEWAKVEYEIAQAEFDQVMNGTPELELERLRIEREGAQAAYDLAQRGLEQARIQAPWGGTVVGIEPREGENVYGYSPIVYLADLDSMHIRAEINELDIAEIREGQAVEVRLDAYPDQVLPGTVTQVLPGVSQARGVTAFEALVEFEGDSLPVVYTGMGANLTIVTQEVTETLLLPRRAIRRAGIHDVVRVVEGRRETEVLVVLGLSNASMVQVLSGVEEGQRVVVD